MSNALSRSLVASVTVLASLVTVFASHAAAGTTEPAVVAARTPASLLHEKTSFETAERVHIASTPVTLRNENVDMLAFPPAKSAGAHPMTLVYLHGKNGLAEKGCPWLRDGASDLGWLVCPEAIEKNDSGTWSWGSDVREQGVVVSRALRAAEQNGASSEPGVAIGFSQGSYVALDLVKTGRGHFRGLVLLAAPEAHPSAQKLHEAGVKRIALAAGRQDGAYAPLMADVKRLQSEGMDARFFDLGNVGHTYAAEDTAALREAIVWAAGN